MRHYSGHRVRSAEPSCRGVADFHEIILGAANGDTDLVDLICSNFDLAPERPLNDTDWGRLENEFARSCTDDMNGTLSALHARRIFDRLRAAGNAGTYAKLVARVEKVYGQVNLDLADLIIAFVQWSLVTSERCGVSNVVFLARDAMPFYVIARELKQRGMCCPDLSILDFNRSMVPRADDSAAHLKIAEGSLAETYLAAGLPGSGRYAVVDTGLYGTLIKAALESCLLDDPVVLFFASKNRHILGYLNTVRNGAGTLPSLDLLGESCCDTLETWPKLYTASKLTADNPTPTATSRLTDPVSAAACLTLYRTLVSRWRTLDDDGLDARAAAERLDKLATARRSFLDLVAPLPAWTYAEQWHSAWTLGPVAPMGERIDEP